MKNVIAKFKNKLLLFLSTLILFNLVIFTGNNTFANIRANTSISYSLTGDPIIGNTISISVNISNAIDLYGGSIDFLYDPTLLELQSITNGGILGNNNLLTPLGKEGKIEKDINGKQIGQASFAISLRGNKPGVNNDGSIAIIKAKILKEGSVNLNTTSNNSTLSLSGNTIRVKLSNGMAGNISYIANNKTISFTSPVTTTLTAGKYEDSHSDIKFVGNWLTDNDPSHSDNTAKYSTTVGDYFEFTFDGTGFDWVQPVNSFRGIAKITIDNVPYTQDTYSASSLFKETVFSKKDLAPGIHTVKIEITNSKNNDALSYNQALDYIEIY